MTKEEKQAEVCIILSHIDGIKSDLFNSVSRLEELGKSRAADALFKLIGKLEAWEHRADLNR